MNAILQVPEDRLLTERETARFLSVSRSFLANSRINGNRENGTQAPPWVRVGKGGVRYSLADLREWIAARRQSPRPFPAGI
jgi:predicted DNA-binding transcriptional regulator AlpA